jgi:hypothetical protein
MPVRACFQATKRKADDFSSAFRLKMARPEGFEPPTPKFVAWCSIQLSYGRVVKKRNCANPEWIGQSSLIDSIHFGDAIQEIADR